MPLEIERKFLVTNDGWKRSVVRSIRIRDGLIALYQGRKVRVRISDDAATITIKGPRSGITRAEFEYAVPSADAEYILSIMCRDDALEKQRHFVSDSGTIWHVDVYKGILDGVVIAEIELTHERQPLTLPDWIGKEVTGESRYKKYNMFAEHTSALRD